MCMHQARHGSVQRTEGGDVVVVAGEAIEARLDAPDLHVQRVEEELVAHHPGQGTSDGEAAAAIRSLRRSSEAWGEFRTPSLRNLSGRAPFMHQGQLANLAAVLEFYSDMAGTTVRGHQIGRAHV